MGRKEQGPAYRILGDNAHRSLVSLPHLALPCLNLPLGRGAGEVARVRDAAGVVLLPGDESNAFN